MRSSMSNDDNKLKRCLRNQPPLQGALLIMMFLPAMQSTKNLIWVNLRVTQLSITPLNFYYSEYLIKDSIEARAVLNSIFSLIVFGDKIWLKLLHTQKRSHVTSLPYPPHLIEKKFLTGS